MSLVERDKLQTSTLFPNELPTDFQPGFFVINEGQWESQVRFRVESGPTVIWFCSDGFVFEFFEPISSGHGNSEPGSELAPKTFQSASEARQLRRYYIHAKLETISPQMQIEGAEPISHKNNYFIGNDPSRWRSNVACFREVTYRNIIDGLDVSFGIENGVVVARHESVNNKDDGQLQFEFSGNVEILGDSIGDLLVRTRTKELRIPTPFSEPIAAADFLHREAITQGQSSSGGALVFSTFLGGSGDDRGWGIESTSDGSVFVVGSTSSSDFPLQDPIDGSYSGGDAFISKLDPTGTVLSYSTYIGGTGGETAYDIEVGSDGSVYIGGITTSSNFPTVNSFDSTYNGVSDYFLAKLSSSGDQIVYATYLGGASSEHDCTICLDDEGSIYLTGWTDSGDFPTSNAFDATFNGVNDVVVSKVGSAGNFLEYSTFLGGSAQEQGTGIAVLEDHAAVVCGFTRSSDFPIVAGYDETLGGDEDAFITKLSPEGGMLVFSTFLGGNNDDAAQAVSTDADDNIYVAGEALSSDFPTANAFAGTRNGSASDAFVTKFNAEGTSLVFSTYLGGSLQETAYGIGVDDSGYTYVAGLTGSSNFPVLNSVDASFNGNADVFITKFSLVGSTLAHSTYLGGGDLDFLHALDVDVHGNCYVTGATASTGYPVVNPYDNLYNGGVNDVFVSMLSAPDTDDDGIADYLDNCPMIANADQADDDEDGTGNWCDRLSVVSVVNSGPGSLREKLTIANARLGPDTIFFEVAGALNLATQLPPISDPSGHCTLIDGLSAPGAAVGVPTIILDGSFAGSGPGLSISSDSNEIRGLLIRDFSGPGIAITGAARWNQLSGNLFSGNAGLSIDLANDGVTINDVGDIDVGPNDLLNYPRIDSVFEFGKDTFTVFGTAVPNASVELYLSQLFNSPALVEDTITDHGPAYQLLGTTTADGSGQFVIDSIARSVWSRVTAIAIDASGNTSEFSRNHILSADPLRVTGYSNDMPFSQLDVYIIGPPDSTGSRDSIGPTYNTFATGGSYVSNVDFDTSGTFDTRVQIFSPDTGLYEIRFEADIPGEHTAGIGVDGHKDQVITISISSMKSQSVFIPGITSQAVQANLSAAATHYHNPFAPGNAVGGPEIDIQDVVFVINCAFRGQDCNRACNVNCDDVTADVLDVVGIVNVAFRGAERPLCAY